MEGPLELWSLRATELLERPVQRRRATTLPPMATCKVRMGILRPAPSRRRSSATRTLDCSGSRPRIDNSSGYLATGFISTMAPTSTVGSVSTNVPASRRAVKPLGSCPFKLSAVKQCFCLPPNHSAVQPLRIDRQTITPLHAVGQLDHQPLKMSSGPAAELVSRPAWQPGVQFSREPSRRLPSCKPLGSQPPTVSCKCG